MIEAVFDVPDDAFSPAGDAEDPTCRLHATVQFRDMLMHLEAITVEYDEKKKTQKVQNTFNDRTFDGMGTIVNGADGPFSTTTIGGREYTLMMTPFC